MDSTREGFAAPTPIKLNSHVVKFDFNLTNNQMAFVRLNVIHDHQTLPQYLPGAISPQVWNHPRGSQPDTLGLSDPSGSIASATDTLGKPSRMEATARGMTRSQVVWQLRK